VDVVLEEPEVVPSWGPGRRKGHRPAGPAVRPLHPEHELIGPGHLVHPDGGGGLRPPEGDGDRLAGADPSWGGLDPNPGGDGDIDRLAVSDLGAASVLKHPELVASGQGGHDEGDGPAARPIQVLSGDGAIVPGADGVEADPVPLKAGSATVADVDPVAGSGRGVGDFDLWGRHVEGEGDDLGAGAVFHPQDVTSLLLGGGEGDGAAPLREGLSGYSLSRPRR